MLLSMGKENLYVWEMTPGMVHENDAAERLLALCGQENMVRSETKEGKIELKAACDGLFRVDSQRLIAVNSREDVMIATRKGQYRREKRATSWRECGSSPSSSRRKHCKPLSRQRAPALCWSCCPM